MTIANLHDNMTDALQAFRRLNVDDQLALLWFVYTKMGSSITPAAPGSAGVEIAESLFNRVKGMSHEEQLQVQRDLLSNADTEIAREYGSLSANTKLLFWYRLAQGMESAAIVPMPPNYELNTQAKELLTALEGADFGQQINFLRDAVLPTGAEPKSGAEI
ncbi:MAG TPA: orange carotenoid protein N-terminal domain-containing protein [Coleofasciculaceae cyanobacterium]